jgi:hypothetical protein
MQACELTGGRRLAFRKTSQSQPLPLHSVLPAPYLSIPGKKSLTPRYRVPFPAASPGPTPCRRLASQHSLHVTFPSLFRIAELIESFFDHVKIPSKFRYIEKYWSVF